MVYEYRVVVETVEIVALSIEQERNVVRLRVLRAVKQVAGLRIE